MGKVTILTTADDFEVKKPDPSLSYITQEEFQDLLVTAEQYVELLRPHRRKNNGLDRALSILQIMRWNGLFSHKFRQEAYAPLGELLDELYAELNL